MCRNTLCALKVQAFLLFSCKPSIAIYFEIEIVFSLSRRSIKVSNSESQKCKIDRCWIPSYLLLSVGLFIPPSEKSTKHTFFIVFKCIERLEIAYAINLRHCLMKFDGKFWQTLKIRSSKTKRPKSIKQQQDGGQTPEEWLEDTKGNHPPNECRLKPKLRDPLEIGRSQSMRYFHKHFLSVDGGRCGDDWVNVGQLKILLGSHRSMILQ